MSFSTYRVPYTFESDESSNSSEDFDANLKKIDISRSPVIAEKILQETLDAIKLQNQALIDRVERLELELATRHERVDEIQNIRPEADAEITDDDTSESIQRINSQRMRDELHLITDFNGNNISVETFIWEIKQVLKDFEGDRKQKLLRLILTQKIIKEARTAIDGIEIHEAEDLFVILRNEFGTVKNYDLMSLERTQCYQRHETVNEYSKRFIRTHRDVKRALANDISIPAEHRKILFANEDKIALPQYIRGLDPKLRIRIQGMRPQNIKEAQDFAMELEREDAMTRELDRRYGRSGSSRRDVAMGSMPTRNSAMARTEQRAPRVVATDINSARFERHEPRTAPMGMNNACYNCGSNRHFVRDCPKPRTMNRDFHTRMQPSAPPDQIKYTVSPPSEMNLQPCTSDWETDAAEDSSQTLVQQ